MNPEVKEMWLTALRSGDYEQGYGTLQATAPGSSGKGRFCCLGVLCDLAVKAGVPVNVTSQPGSGYIAYDGERGTLPTSVQNWAGLDSPDPMVRAASGFNLGLSAHNDGGTPFPEIANLIEEHL